MSKIIKDVVRLIESGSENVFVSESYVLRKFSNCYSLNLHDESHECGCILNKNIITTDDKISDLSDKISENKINQINGYKVLNWDFNSFGSFDDEDKNFERVMRKILKDYFKEIEKDDYEYIYFSERKLDDLLRFGHVCNNEGWTGDLVIVKDDVLIDFVRSVVDEFYSELNKINGN